MNTQEQRAILPPPRRHWARQTHRVLGVASAIFLVLISTSGLILNHADDFGMSHRAAAPWLLRLYGDELPPVDSAFSAAGVLFATSSSTLFANGEELAKNSGLLIGAIATDDVYIIATGREFLITNSDLELLERYAPDATALIERLGKDGERVIVAMQNALYELDPRNMSLSEPLMLPMDKVFWAQSATPSAEQAEQIGTAALGQAINWERVLLDLHSGRILPTLGRYLADLTALCILYMCFTGLFVWVRKR